MSTPGSSPGIWLMELDTGGEVLHVGSEAAVVTSRQAGGEVRYSPGLGKLTAQVETDALPLSFPAPSLALDRSRLGSLWGRPVKVWWYRGEAYVEDALLAFDGVVRGYEISIPGQEGVVRLDTTADLDLSTSDMVGAQGAVTDDTWPQATYLWSDPIAGMPYPWVIGAPGDRGSAEPPTPGVPVLNVYPAPLATVVVVARGHTPAAQVQIWDLSTYGQYDTVPTAHGTDQLGQDITTAALNTGAVPIDPDGNAPLIAGFSRAAGWGTGLEHKGREVTGLGDLLVWGSDMFAGTVRFDTTAIESRREKLNRYVIDCVINQTGVSWAEWVASNLTELFQIELAIGPRGRYWREIRWVCDPLGVRATLVCDRSAPGIQVSRASGISEQFEEDGPTSELVIQYAHNYTGAYTRRRAFGPENRDYASGIGDGYMTAHPMLVRANELLRQRPDAAPRSVNLYAGVVWDPTTAELLGNLHVSRVALPHRYLQITGPEDLLDIEPYATVRVLDTAHNLDVLALALPKPIIDGSGVVTRTLRIPPDLTPPAG